MASPLVGSLIQQHVIPQIYHNAPSTTIPRNQDGSLNMLEIVKEAVRLFDKDLSRNDWRIHSPTEIRFGLWVVVAMHAFQGKVCMTQS